MQRKQHRGFADAKHLIEPCLVYREAALEVSQQRQALDRQHDSTVAPVDIADQSLGEATRFQRVEDGTILGRSTANTSANSACVTSGLSAATAITEGPKAGRSRPPPVGIKPQNHICLRELG